MNTYRIQEVRGYGNILSKKYGAERELKVLVGRYLDSKKGVKFSEEKKHSFIFHKTTNRYEPFRNV